LAVLWLAGEQHRENCQRSRLLRASVGQLQIRHADAPGFAAAAAHVALRVRPPECRSASGRSTRVAVAGLLTLTRALSVALGAAAPWAAGALDNDG
jgi:hypothetical protein